MKQNRNELFLKKIKYFIETLSTQIKARIEDKKLTNEELVKINCIAYSYSLTAIACVASLTMLITSECKEPSTGCLVAKVLSQIYRITFSTILPQIFIVYLLSFYVIKIRYTFSLEKIITNFFLLNCLNLLLMSSTVYMANYNERVSYKFIVTISLLCPLISQLLSNLALKYLNHH